MRLIAPKGSEIAGWSANVCLTRYFLSVVMTLIMAIGSGYFAFNAESTDVHADWLTARASWLGDSYQDVRDLAEDYGVPFDVAISEGRESVIAIHPRLPGALLLQSLLLFVPYGMLWYASLVLNILLLGVVLAWGAGEMPFRHWILLALGIIYSFPTFLALRNSSQILVIAVLLQIGMSEEHRAVSYLQGATLGIAATLKVFPAVVLLGARRRVVLSAVVVGGALNVAGLATPGVSIVGMFQFPSSASAAWLLLPSNGSVASVAASLGLSAGLSTTLGLSAGVVAAGLLVWRGRADSLDGKTLQFMLVTIGLLSIPLSWAAYDLVLVPCMWFLAERMPTYVRVHVLVWVAMFICWIFLGWSMTAAIVASRLALMFALWMGGERATQFGTSSLGPRLPA